MTEPTIAQLDAGHDWQGLAALAHWTIEQAIALQQIPAPTFFEAARAAWVADHFREIGLQSVRIDDLSNVYALLPGRRGGAAHMVAAHTDTVFGAETPLDIRREGDLIYGPGLGDNSLGVAGMLAAARALAQSEPLAGDLWFVATTREEGLGDLGGMRAAFNALRPQLRGVINLEGMALGQVYHAGIAVRRLRIRARASGGHSWLHFGRPSAIHGLMRLGARISAFNPPAVPRTTYNIGMISGGSAINAIATEAEMWLDLRSEDTSALAVIEAYVRREMALLTVDDLHFSIEVVGDRPAGTLHPRHPLVETALQALAQVHMRGTLETGSTDANVPLAAGVPAITIGISRGGNAHRLDEFIETPPVAAGLRQLVLVLLAVASA